MTYQIRAYFQDDLEEMTELAKRSMSHPWTLQQLQTSWRARFPAWILECEQQMLGFILVMSAPDVIHINCFVIDKEHQRCGFGQQLLSHVIEYANNQHKDIVLEVRVSNKSAITLYEKNGFKIIGRRKNYYVENNQREDAWVFQRPLDKINPGN